MAHKDVFVYFSDDAALAYRCSDGILFANIDISSCDSSNSGHVFEALYRVVPEHYHAVVQRLIEQCSCECWVGPRFNKLKFKPTEPFEYSGTVLTTALNNLASSRIGFACADHLSHERSVAENARGLQAAIGRVGWSVTVQLGTYEELQFLKHSPVSATDGLPYAVLNLGVILRALGSCDGDLPGRGPLDKRAKEWWHGVAQSFKHSGRHRLTDIVVHKYDGVSPNARLSYFQEQLCFADPEFYTNVRFDDYQLIKRYGISTSSYEEALQLLSEADFGDVVSSDVFRTIIRKDYGIE
jgi:hypothetical protein